MKILMISSYLPYPLYSGGQVRLYNLIKELSDKHEITLICEKRANQSNADISEVKKICRKVITLDRRKQWSIGNILKAGTSAHSFLLTGHTLPDMQQKIREELANNTFDLIHVETYYVMQNVPLTDIPVVLVEHNIEYKVYEKFLNRAPAYIRPLLGIDVSKIRNEEERFWRKADSLVAVSTDDKDVMEAAGFSPRIVSNGVNTEQFAYKDLKKTVSTKEKRILFIGDFRWIQNKDSVSFIIKEIWPVIKENFFLHSGEERLQNLKTADRSNVRDSGQARMTRENNLKFWIVGRNIPDSVRSLTDDPNVLFDTESSAKPTQEIFQEASVLLAPIRVGGGTSYKILESMSSGTPVVTMQLSADALEAKDGREIMVGKNALELADKTVHLLQDENVYERISKQGRKFVEEHYTWKEIAKRLDEVYKKVKS